MITYASGEGHSQNQQKNGNTTLSHLISIIDRTSLSNIRCPLVLKVGPQGAQRWPGRDFGKALSTGRGLKGSTRALCTSRTQLHPSTARLAASNASTRPGRLQIGFPTSFLVRFRLSPLLSPLSRPEPPDLLSDFASQLFVNKNCSARNLK